MSVSFETTLAYRSTTTGRAPVDLRGVILCEASAAGAAEKIRDAFDTREFARLGAEVRKDAAAYALEICGLSTPARR